jgi:hypothetical protein
MTIRMCFPSSSSSNSNFGIAKFVCQSAPSLSSLLSTRDRLPLSSSYHHLLHLIPPQTTTRTSQLIMSTVSPLSRISPPHDPNLILQTKQTIICGVTCDCAPKSSTAAACDAKSTCVYAANGGCSCEGGVCQASVAKGKCAKGLAVSSFHCCL